MTAIQTAAPGARKGSNRWATMSRASAAKPAKKRRKLDDYETPASATHALAPFLSLSGPLLEPAAGSGRMVRALKELFPALKIESSDIKRGRDFLKRTAPFKGHCFTNPPYGGGQAEAFARHALKLASGKVGMLMQLDWLTGARRAEGIFLGGLKPELIVVIPWRVMFIEGDGKEIEGQFFNHCWVVWPERDKREKNRKTRIEWANPPDEMTFG
jgi:hypothetical protein